MGHTARAGNAPQAVHRAIAPRPRAGLALALLTSSLALLTLAGPAQARVVLDSFGPDGSLGDQIRRAEGIAVNSSGAGGVVSGTVYVADSLSGRVARFSPAGAFERVWGFDTIQTGKPGDTGTGFEVCTVAADCKAGTTTDTTANGGQLNEPSGIAVSQSSGSVYVSETANRRISQFDPDGNFVRTFGWDVVLTGGTDDVSTNAYEVCTVANECKQAALEKGGASGGQFGGDPVGTQPAGSTRDIGLAVDSSGDIWATDAANRRIQRFDAAGNFVAAYGWDVDALGGSGQLESCTSTALGACQAADSGSLPGQFHLTGNFSVSPKSLTFDSIGNLYASDVDRVQRFDFGVGSASEFVTAELAGYDIKNQAQLAATGEGDRIALSANEIGKNHDLIVEFNLAGELVESSLPGDSDEDSSTSSRVNGLAYDSSSDRLYVTGTGGFFSHHVLTLGDAPSPVSVLDPIATIGSRTATFTGTVDPMVGLAKCDFQYSEDKASWTEVSEPDCGSLDPHGGPQMVSEDVTGLDPFTHYFVRLRVMRFFDDSTIVYSSEEEFTTEATPPELSAVGVRLPNDTSATAVGLIDPGKAPTEYRFEYGTAGPCDLNPCDSTAEQHLAPGFNKPTPVSTELTGLAPDTTYHLRLIADNTPSGGGLTEGSGTTFHTFATPFESDSRAYEMVSPPEKNGAGALTGWQFAAVAPGGGAVGFCTDSLFGEPSGVQFGVCASYLSRRTEQGWQTRAAAPYACASDVADGTTSPAGAAFDQAVRFSADMSAATFLQPESSGCPLSPLVAGAPMPQQNLYRVDYSSDPFSFDLLTPNALPSPAVAEDAGTVLGASADLSHVVYSSASAQTPDAPPGDFDKLYEWSNGTLSLVSRDPLESPFTADAELPGGTTLLGFADFGLGDLVNAVSEDGSRVYFQTPAGEASQELYLREDGLTTYDVSASECTSACGANAADSLLFASPDGSRAYVSSTAKLTDSDSNADGRDLFLYAHSPNPSAEENLTFVSEDSEPADGTRADVLDVLGVSDDGKTVVFAADGQLLPGKPTETGPKLYRWVQGADGDPPTLTYLATLDTGDGSNWNAGINGTREDRRLTPDGRHLLISTARALAPVDDRDVDRDIYRWDAQNGWLCVSCVMLGGPSAGHASGPAFSGNHGGRRISMSDDGRVFFTTPSALVSADTNEASDVYEWREGRLALISSGTAPGGAILLGASASGKDVFFLTSARLLGADTDSVNDVYDARIDGGFPEPDAEAPCDLNGGACEGEGSSAAEQAGAGSAVFEGPGNRYDDFSSAKDRCARLATAARRRVGTARRLRLRARRLVKVAKRTRNRARSRAARRKGRRLAKVARRRAGAAKRDAIRAKRCRRARQVNANRRAAR